MNHSAAVHYDARFAAEGGPIFTGPTIDPALLASDESATVAILFSQETQQWTVADSQGNVYAESIDPKALISWMSKYLTALSDATLGSLDETEDERIVRLVRTTCAEEFSADYSSDFFAMDYEPGETADEALARLFHAERKNQDTDRDTALVLCHG